MNISANFRKNSKWLQWNTWGPGGPWFMKKTWSRKSRVRLPLSELSAQTQERRGEQGTAANHCFAACSSLPFCLILRFLYAIQENCDSIWDRSWEYINLSKTHECRNREQGCPISFLGIYICFEFLVQCWQFYSILFYSSFMTSYSLHIWSTLLGCPRVWRALLHTRNGLTH